MPWIWIQALLVNVVLISLARRIPLLTPKGWVHAAVLGTMLWGCLGWRGWLAVVIYLALGSLATHIGLKNKQQRGLAEARGGRRGPENVWGSAAVGAALGLWIAALPPDAADLQILLMIGFSASLAAKLADTFGSEIGKRWGSTTVLITSLRPVTPGTEGAISLQGTLASVVGSIVMTMVLWALQLIPSLGAAGLVMMVGLLATLAESLLGAIVQNRVGWLSNELVNALQTLLAATTAIILAG
ncbi:DUF92 domain-containing protein [Synechococcus sp. M16CYN]|uniref:DUF92 domain-containing protein n=1 Tax=Synechococcus sp. M16CYN TaxID=3103139 RepID=UPI003254F746